MQKLLFAVGTAFLRAFGAALLTFALGILAAPNFTVAVSLSIAALCASIAAGLRAVQVWVPFLTFAAWVRQPVAAYLDSFARAAISALIITLTGWLLAPDLTTWKAVITAAVVGALAAGFRAVQGATSVGELPKPESGIVPPGGK